MAVGVDSVQSLFVDCMPSTCTNMRGARKLLLRPQGCIFCNINILLGVLGRSQLISVTIHERFGCSSFNMTDISRSTGMLDLRFGWAVWGEMVVDRHSMDGSKSSDPYPGVKLLFSGQILWIESRGGKWDGHSLAFYFYELMEYNIYYVYFGSTSSQGFKLMTISLASYIYHRFSSYHNSWCLMSVRFCTVGFVVSCRIAWRFAAYATRSSMSLGSSSGHQCNTTLGHVDAPRPCSTHQSEGAQKNSGLNLKQGPRTFGISQAIYESECSSSAGGGAGIS